VKSLFESKDNNKTQLYCDTILSLLLIDLKRNGDIDVPKFLKKIDATMKDIKGKPCPIVVHMLKLLVDRGLEQDVKEDGYVFSAEKSWPSEDAEVMERFVGKYEKNFSDKEKMALENLSPVTYYTKTPDEFHDLLVPSRKGPVPYFLNGFSDSRDMRELHGVLGLDSLHMTPEEEDTMTKGCHRIPLGAIVVMYSSALKSGKLLEE